MKSKEVKSFSVMALLAVLAIAPISSVAFAQTQLDASTEAEIKAEINSDESQVSVNTETNVSSDTSNDNPDSDKNVRKEIRDQKQQTRDEIKQFRDEKIKDLRERIIDQYKDKVVDTRTDIRQIDTDRAPDLTFYGTTSGFMIFGGIAHKSEITLDGSAYHVQNSLWQIKSDGKIAVGDRSAKLEMKGYARGNNIVLHGNGELDNGEKVRLFLRGHFAPTPETGVFAMAFTQAGLHNINTGERIPMMHVGTVQVIPTSNVEPVFTDTIPSEE